MTAQASVKAMYFDEYIAFLLSLWPLASSLVGSGLLFSKLFPQCPVTVLYPLLLFSVQVK